MRRYVIAFFITVFLLVMMAVLLNLLNPFNEAAIAELVKSESINAKEELYVVLTQMVDKGLGLDYLNIRNLAVILGLAAATITAGIAGMHLVFERLFLLKFYEETSVEKAYRRGAVVASALIGVLILKLMGTAWYVQLALAVVVLGAEVLISHFYKQPAKIRAEYLSDTEIQTNATTSLGHKIVTGFNAGLNYLGRSLKLAYTGTKGKIDQVEQTPIPQGESVIISSDEPETTDV